MSMINIDFNNKADKEHRIERIILSNEAQNRRFLFGLMSREVNINYHSIAVTNLKIPEVLEVANHDRVVRLRCMQNETEVESNILNNISIRANEFFIDIIFDEKEIADCDADSETFTSTISFSIEFRGEKGVLIKKHDISLDIHCTRAESDVRYNIVIDQNYLTGQEYKCRSNVEIGWLEIESVSPYYFSKTIENCRLGIGFDSLIIKNAISFGSEADNKNGVISVLEIQELKAKATVKIPLLADFSQLKNPKEAEVVRGTFTMEYQKDNHIRPRSEQFYITILPDTTQAALSTSITTDRSSYKELGLKEAILDKYYWQGKDASGKTNCFYIQLANLAEVGDGGIEIRNFAIEFFLHDDSESTLAAKNEDLSSNGKLDRFFMINDETLGELPNGFFLSNEAHSCKEFGVGFKHDKIAAIPGVIATIVCNVVFEYKIIRSSAQNESNGLESDFFQYSSEIEFKIEKYTGNSWLALDFGTSATVVAYGNGADMMMRREEDLLLNLQESLESHHKSKYNTLEVSEKDTCFLSSEIMLKPNGGLIDSTCYWDDIVMLSPGVNDMHDHLELKIPFLKSLIGLENLPVFHDKLNEHKYRLNKESEDYVFKEHPISVNTILKNTYNSLFRDFIVSRLNDDEQLDKIIITVPNTFTPKHLDLIRGIIQEKYASFRKDYITFISESDAVACNYLLNRSDYNFYRTEEPKNSHKEYVLVYDIGAGTTDLTYFCISQLENGKKEIEIVGRLGKSTAGNYLDYVIAKIINAEYNPKTGDKKFNFTQPEDNDTRGAAHKIKLFIRNHIKPQLDNSHALRVYLQPDGTISEYDEGEGADEFDCSVILEHLFMKQYFTNNSESLMSDFFNLFQSLPGRDAPLEKGQIPIDTVLFTGRTSQFEGLREQVKNCIKEWSDRSVYFTSIEESDKLKNVVAKGALQFALRFRDSRVSKVSFKNRNLLARYGVLYNDPDNPEQKYVFKEFLNPATRPIHEEPVVTNGLSIYEYDTDIANALNGEEPFIDLSNTPTLLFVQSFSSDTAKNANDSNWEYITVMYKIDSDLVTLSSNIDRVKVRVVIDDRNEMKIFIGHRDDVDAISAPLQMDLLNNETFKHSMWPYLSNKNH
ncbi:MAG: hypothetical protein MI974_06345 [Chitinophagales bacterium]|nr:hypothetical protein [Chitinophagales bacterium]